MWMSLLLMASSVFLTGGTCLGEQDINQLASDALVSLLIELFAVFASGAFSAIVVF
jgi:hypothetical protein